jgi:hypothetical protein
LPWIAALLVVLALGIVVAVAADSTDGPPSDPIDQMVIAFDGNPPKAEIEQQVNRAIELYDLPATDDSQSRIGSVLVSFKQQDGIPEMQLLDCTIQTATPGVNVSFPDAAALNAAAITTTGSCK